MVSVQGIAADGIGFAGQPFNGSNSFRKRKLAGRNLAVSTSTCALCSYYWLATHTSPQADIPKLSKQDTQAFLIPFVEKWHERQMAAAYERLTAVCQRCSEGNEERLKMLHKARSDHAIAVEQLYL